MSTTMQDAEVRAETGMQRAAQHAENDDPGWCARALQALRQFAVDEGEALFTIETARSALWSRGLKGPPELRAWGAVTRAASKAGYIAMTDRMERCPSSNGSPKPLWRRGPNA